MAARALAAVFLLAAAVPAPASAGSPVGAVSRSAAPRPVALYGLVLLCAAVAYFILARTLIALHGRDSTLGVALGRDVKGKVSMLLYLAAVLLAFVYAPLACLVYVLVAVIWLVPDRRIERTLRG